MKITICSNCGRTFVKDIVHYITEIHKDCKGVGTRGSRESFVSV